MTCICCCLLVRWFLWRGSTSLWYRVLFIYFLFKILFCSAQHLPKSSTSDRSLRLINRERFRAFQQTAFVSFVVRFWWNIYIGETRFSLSLMSNMLNGIVVFGRIKRMLQVTGCVCVVYVPVSFIRWRRRFCQLQIAFRYISILARLDCVSQIRCALHVLHSRARVCDLLTSLICSVRCNRLVSTPTDSDFTIERFVVLYVAHWCSHWRIKLACTWKICPQRWWCNIDRWWIRPTTTIGCPQAKKKHRSLSAVHALLQCVTVRSPTDIHSPSVACVYLFWR